MPRTFVSEFPADMPAYERDARRDRLRGAGVPPRHAARVVEAGGPWGAARAQMLEALEPGGSIVVLSGIRGCGKTQLATEACRVYCRSGYSARYIKAVDLFLSLREGMNSDKSEQAAVKPFLAPDLLVIDAMEERGETDWENRMFGYIMDRRYDAMSDTILITNQERGRFGESVGLSVVSRLHECGTVIECKWESFREKA